MCQCLFLTVHSQYRFPLRFAGLDFLFQDISLTCYLHEWSSTQLQIISELNKVQWKCILLALSYTNKVSFQLLISYDITSLLCKTAKVYAFKTERTPSKRCHNRRYSLMKSKTLFLSFFLCVDVLIELLLIDT